MIRSLIEHKNMEHIQEIVYAKATEYKIQVFLEHGKSLRGQNSPKVFRKLWKLYDIAKNVAS